MPVNETQPATATDFTCHCGALVGAPCITTGDLAGRSHENRHRKADAANWEALDVDLPTVAYQPGIAESRRGDRQPFAPAIKRCADCDKPKVDLRKRSTFGIREDGALVCPRCWQKGMARLDAEGTR